jgi:hypothetical protein
MKPMAIDGAEQEDISDVPQKNFVKQDIWLFHHQGTICLGCL